MHLCILGTCGWDLIKDLSTWLALPLQHDWNVHNSVCELPRVSVPSGSLALVFALHDLRDFNHLADVRNLQDSNRLLHLLNHGKVCCFTTDISTILPLCRACARHLPLPVRGNVNGLDRWNIPLRHLCHIDLLSIYCSSRISTCLSNRLIFASRIVVQSNLRVRQCLEDLGFVSHLALQLTCQMCWLWIEFSIACSPD